MLTLQVKNMLKIRLTRLSLFFCLAAPCKSIFSA